jgi:cytochrome oxidase assembly protein ShyY1
VSWRFALSPGWLVRHVLVVGLVAVMLWAGFWQLRRLDDKRAHRDLVAERQAEPVADVEALLPAGAAVDDADVERSLHRRVIATGTYADEDTVVVENRSFNGAPGGWVLTPLLVDDGTAVVVNRGFIGFDRDGRIVAPDAPSGRVTVEGLVLPSQRREGIGRSDPSEGTLAVMSRVDVERYQAQVDVELLPAYVQLVASDPAQPPAAPGDPELVALGEPTLDLGPHLGYAVQWFVFSTIATAGYVLILRRVARDRAREAAIAAEDATLDQELQDLLRNEG